MRTGETDTIHNYLIKFFFCDEHVKFYLEISWERLNMFRSIGSSPQRFVFADLEG